MGGGKGPPPRDPGPQRRHNSQTHQYHRHRLNSFSKAIKFHSYQNPPPAPPNTILQTSTMSTIWTTWTVRRSQHSSRKAPLPAKTPCTRSTSSLTQGSLPQFPSIWLPMSPARLSRKQNKQPWKKRWKWRNHVQYTHLRKSLLFFFFLPFFRKTILSDKDYKNTQRPLHVKTHTH